MVSSFTERYIHSKSNVRFRCKIMSAMAILRRDVQCQYSHYYFYYKAQFAFVLWKIEYTCDKWGPVSIHYTRDDRYRQFDLVKRLMEITNLFTWCNLILPAFSIVSKWQPSHLLQKRLNYFGVKNQSQNASSSFALFTPTFAIAPSRHRAIATGVYVHEFWSDGMCIVRLWKLIWRKKFPTNFLPLF